MNTAVSLLRESPGQDVAFCPGVVDLKHALSEAFDGRRTAVLFTGRVSAERCGAYAAVAEAAAAAGCRLFHFRDIEPEPDTTAIAAMRDFLDAHPADMVLAAGGGSVMDAAKAAYLIFQSRWEISRHFGTGRYSSVCPERLLKRVVALPTTSGTGSECTAYSNIVDRGNAVKKLICEPQIIPERTIIYPQFTISMPRRVTLATGCDALAHLVEGLLNVRADADHPRANCWALRGIELIHRYLPRALEFPEDGEARRAMSLAAALGGMVIRYKSTGLPHLCSFSWFGRIEHGIAATLLLPASWRYYLEEPSVAERTMLLSGIFGGREPEAVVSGFRRFLTGIGVPSSLSACDGITPELLELTAASGMENAMKLELAPRRVPPERSREILAGILEAAWRG